MVDWLIKRAERGGRETAVKYFWKNMNNQQKRDLVKLTQKDKWTNVKFLSGFKKLQDKRKSQKIKRHADGITTNTSQTRYIQCKQVCNYLYRNYQDNWIKFIITAIIITIVAHYLFQAVITFLEQARQTMVSFYKWKILSSVVAPTSIKNSNSSYPFDFINITSWINLIKTILSTII